MSRRVDGSSSAITEEGNDRGWNEDQGTQHMLLH